MAAASLRGELYGVITLKNFGSLSYCYTKARAYANFCPRAFRASQESLDDDNSSKFYKELGMLSLRKRIEDSIVRAETLMPIALEYEKAKHVSREEVIHADGLWDDLCKSSQFVVELANSAKAVDALRDLKYKAEEAKLITELAATDSINYELFRQAYHTFLDLNTFLDKYEMSKLLKEPYDMEGACITIESRCGDISSERWVGLLAEMYMKWAERQGHTVSIVETSPSNNGGLKSATIELEFKFAYGNLSGERGIHSLIRNSESKDVHLETSSASVDVFPLFIESSPDLLINDEDILVSYPSCCQNNPYKTSSAVQIQHMPTGLIVQSSSERSLFANKIKALNRMKSKLLIVHWDLGLSSPKSIKNGDVTRATGISETRRRYVLGPTKMVHDLRSEMQLRDVNGVLNGNLDALIAAHLNSRTN